jgi:hypothetical protein
MLSEIYWSFFTTSVITACLAVFTLCYRSKCRECSFCGIKIVRDVDIELQEDMKVSNEVKT